MTSLGEVSVDIRYNLSKLEADSQKAKAKVTALKSELEKIASLKIGSGLNIDTAMAKALKGATSFSAELRRSAAEAQKVVAANAKIEAAAAKANAEYDKMRAKAASVQTAFQAKVDATVISPSSGKSAKDSASAIREAEREAKAIAKIEAEAEKANAAFYKMQASLAKVKLPTSLQQQIDAATASSSGLSRSPKEIEGAFKDAEREANKLLRLYPKMESAQERFNREIAQASKLYKQGSISATQFNQIQNGAVKQFGIASDLAARKAKYGMGLASHEVTNLGFQINDIAQGLATGNQSPFTILIQQGAQLSQILGNKPGGLGGTLKALGAGLASFLNPVTLAVAGLAGLTLAGQKLYEAVSDSAAAEAALERQNNLLSKMADRYDSVREAFERLDEVSSDSPLQRSLDVRDITTELQLLDRQIAQTTQGIANQLSTQANVFAGMGEPLTEVGQQFRDLKTATDEAINVLNSGDINSFVDKMLALENQVEGLDSGTQELFKDFIDGIDNADTGLLTLIQKAEKLRSSLVLVGEAALSSLSRIQQIAHAAAQIRVGGAFDTVSSAESDFSSWVQEQEKASKAGLKQSNAYQKTFDAAQKRVQQLQLEAQTFGMTEQAADKYLFKMELLNQVMELNGQITDKDREKVEALANAWDAADSLRDRQKELVSTLDDVRGKSESFMTSFINDMRNGATAAEAFQNVLSKIGDQLASFASSKIIESILGPAGGGFGGLFGSLFADGGIMTSNGSLPLNKYASGGIANSPQMAVFGEGRKPEAYVPLPDGRTIPVTMTSPNRPSIAPQGVKLDLNNNITVSVDDKGAIQAYVNKTTDQKIAASAPNIVNASVAKSQKVLRDQRVRGSI